MSAKKHLSSFSSSALANGYCISMTSEKCEARRLTTRSSHCSLRTSHSYEYDGFGNLLRATGPATAWNNFTFSTKYQDNETGWFYYGYRYYDAANGRWTSRDPIEEKGGMNLYGMVGNDAISKFDRLGLIAPVVVVAVGVGLEIATRLAACAQLNPGESALISTPASVLSHFSGTIAGLVEKACGCKGGDVKVRVSKSPTAGGNGNWILDALDTIMMCDSDLVIICNQYPSIL